MSALREVSPSRRLGLPRGIKSFDEKDMRSSYANLEPGDEVTPSEEQWREAMRESADAIALRLADKPMPSAVRSLLCNAWKDVLVLAHLRRAVRPCDWDAALHLMDKLIWSVEPPTDLAMRGAIIHTIPKLLRGIRAGLESIRLDPRTVALALKDLEDCHLAGLSKPVPETPIAGSNSARMWPANDDDAYAGEVLSPELAKILREIQGNLPDVENLTVQEVCESTESTGTGGFAGGAGAIPAWLSEARADSADPNDGGGRERWEIASEDSRLRPEAAANFFGASSGPALPPVAPPLFLALRLIH
jgi:hypothetical protein